MKTARFEVLSQQEIERIHAASIEILADVGIRVDYGKARDLFRQAGAQVDEDMCAVHIPAELVEWALEQSPSSFTLKGHSRPMFPRFPLDSSLLSSMLPLAGAGTRKILFIFMERGAARGGEPRLKANKHTEPPAPKSRRE